MIIGVDGGMLAVSDERLKVGVWRVAANLLRELGQLDTENHYRLYSFAPIEKKLLQSFGPRMENRVLTPTTGWFSLRVPLELRLHPVDIFLGLGQALPPGRQRNIGFVYDVGFLHHPDLYPDSQNRLARQTQELVKRAGQIVAISQAVKGDISKVYRLLSSRITVAHPGVDKHFGPTGKKFKGQYPYFLFVGALKRGKNIPTLLAAFAMFFKEKKEVYDLLLIGGDYWLDPEIEKTLKQLRIGERVARFGFVSDDKLPSYYRGAVALVVPSLVEGFCLPVVEAMASGCPVVASDIPVMREIVGEAGVFVDPTSEIALTQALTKVADQRLRRKLSTVGLKRAKQYSWHGMAEKVLALIHET